MSPELIDSVKLDGRADIYSLGVVLFEMAAGRPPYDDDSVAGLLARHKWSPVPSIREVCANANCSSTLEVLIRRCLEKDPAARLQSAAELATALAEG